MHSKVWHNKNLCVTNLFDQRLTHIIRINKYKSHAEICCSRVSVHYFIFVVVVVVVVFVFFLFRSLCPAHAGVHLLHVCFNDGLPR